MYKRQEKSAENLIKGVLASKEKSFSKVLFGLGIRYVGETVAKKSVTLYDTVTTDAFSTVVKQTGYIIDGISLANGMRVVFAADTDPLVKNKIYDVNFVTAGDSTQVISLTEATDATPANDDSIFIEFGTVNQGKTFRYDSTTETVSYTHLTLPTILRV